MERIVLSLAQWQAVVLELEGVHTASAPPGLLERVRELVAQVPRAWPHQRFALELDPGSAQAVRSVRASIEQRDPYAAQRGASVDEAVQIIRDHQQRS